MIYLWIALFIVLIVIEVVTPIELISIWFMPAVIVCGVLTLLNASYYTQLITFIILSVLGTVGLFLYLSKKKSKEAVNIERFDGEHIIFLNEKKESMLVIKDVNYLVKSTDDTVLNEGEAVKVVEIKGNTLIVERM